MGCTTNQRPSLTNFRPLRTIREAEHLRCTLAATIHENRTSGADASAKGSFWGREKQDVFLAASMDGFTAAPERPFRDRGCACLTLHMNNAG
jgi:hypothetical protein